MSDFQTYFNAVVEEVVQKVGADFERLAADYDDDFQEVLVDCLPDFLFMATDQPTVRMYEAWPSIQRQQFLRTAVKGF